MRYPGTDSSPWQVATFAGEVFRDSNGEKLNKFKGFKDANKAAQKLGGVATRA